MTRLLIIIALLSNAPVARAGTPEGQKIIGYYAGWAKHYQPADIPADKLTHVNYAFALIIDVRCAVNREEAAEKNFAGLRELKAKHPHLRTLISVGGWTGSGPFSDTAATDASRKIFAQSCANFAHKHGFDGVDIDWEFPGGGGFEKDKWRKEDTQNFTALLTDLRRALDEQGQADHKQYLLTIAAPASPSHYNKMELAKIHPLLDAINLMTYDFAGFWSKQTNFNSPLYSADNDPAGPTNSADAAVRGYLAAGVPPEKIVLGVPFYGRSWIGVKDINHGLYQAHAGKWPEAKETGKEWSYWDIEKNYLPDSNSPRSTTARRYWSDQAKVPWIYDPSAQLMISYDDPQSLRLKAQYAHQHNLGGVMIWELSEDNRQHSLLNALNEGLTGN